MVPVNNLSSVDHKRIRLTPVSGAIASISQSQGAIGMDDEDVVFCLAPKTFTVEYKLASTGDWVQIDTGPIVSMQTIDPDVDFTNTQSASYQAWMTSLEDRVELRVSNADQVAEATFSDWQSLTKVEVDATVIDVAAFSYLNVTDVTIGPRTRRIESGGFAGCWAITNLTIADGLEYIGDGAMSGLNSCMNLALPNTLTAVGNSPFGGFPQGAHLSTGNGLTTITTGMFAGWAGGALTLGTGLITLEDYAFGSGTWTVDTLVIPGNIKSIGQYAFQNWNCKNLIIENGVGAIGDYAFSMWTGVESIALNGGTTFGQYSFGDWETYAGPLTIPSTATTIAGYAFQNWKAATALTILEGITDVQAYAFTGWRLATDLTLPNSLTLLNGSFREWYNLSNISLGNAVTQIGSPGFGNQEFANAGRNAITPAILNVGDTVTTMNIGFDGLREFRGGRNLATLNGYISSDKFTLFRLEAVVPPVTSNDFYFNDNGSEAVIWQIPAGSEDEYLASADWDDYINQYTGNGRLQTVSIV